jgi:16S rRNA (guanine(966)-N(2))-methyltransferase RsmD
MRVGTGEAKGRKLKSPKTIGTRPITARVKTALFDILAGDVEEVRLLDLFGGTGSVGIEALSRGAAHATFIEMNYKIVKLIRENLALTGMSDRADVIQGDAFKFLQAQAANPTRTYDMVYVAPPQYEELAAKALGILETSPLVAEDGLVIVQIHPKERPSVAAIACERLELCDERRYGSTLLMFYRPRAKE